LGNGVVVGMMMMMNAGGGGGGGDETKGRGTERQTMRSATTRW